MVVVALILNPRDRNGRSQERCKCIPYHTSYYHQKMQSKHEDLIIYLIIDTICIYIPVCIDPYYPVLVVTMRRSRVIGVEHSQRPMDI